MTRPWQLSQEGVGRAEMRTHSHTEDEVGKKIRTLYI